MMSGSSTIGERIRELSELTPEAPVLLARGRSPMKFRDLALLLERCRTFLNNAGIGRNQCVALMCDQTVEAAAAFLGICDTAAVAPLDYRMTEHELRLALKSVPFEALVVKRGLETAAAVARDIGLTVIELVPAPEGPAGDVELVGQRASSPAQPGPVLPEDMGTIQMTSGTTGRPKAALANQGQLLRRAITHVNSSALNATDVGTTFSPPYVSALFNRIAVSVASGGSVFLRDGFDADGFFHDLADFGITWYAAGPTFHRAILARAPYHAAELARSKLRLIRSSTTKLQPEMMAQLEETFGVPCIEQYATTETSLIAANPLPPAERKPGKVGVAIGCEVAVFDDTGTQLPANIIGSIAVRSDLLFSGYLGDPEMTARAFRDGWFFTSDMGCIDEDGYIELTGRKQELINRGGETISPLEVERVLASHDAVSECLCFPAPHPTLGQIAAAAVTLKPDRTTTSQELRHFAADRLSAYKVPTPIVIVDAIPSTPSGKIRRLDAYESLGLANRQVDRIRNVNDGAPGDYSLRSSMVDIWKSILNVSAISGDDEFFAIGGDSLQAMRLVILVEEVTGVALPIEAVYAEGATLDGMVSLILATRERTAAEVAARAKASAAEVPPNGIPPVCEAITPGMLTLVSLNSEEIERVVAAVSGGAANVQDIYPLAPPQEGVLFHHLMAREDDPYVLQRMFGFDSRARLDGFVQALRAVVDRHDILRTAVLWEGLPEPVQVVLRRAPLVVEEVSLEPAGGDVAQQLAARTKPGHFRLDVRRAPLLHLFVAQDVANGRWVMALLLHRLATDHTSLGIMLQEIQAHLQGRDGQLPAPVPFRNFVAQARLGVSGEEHEAFFKKMLGHVDEPTAPFGLTDVYGGGSGIVEFHRAVEAELARRLRERARALGVTAASVFHLAWAQVLARVSGHEDVVFGTVLFGRMRGGEGADRALGLFANTLPVRIQVGEEGVQESVRQIHRLLAQLLHHEHASLALAQKCSAVAAPSPLFSALLNFRHSTEAGQLPFEGSQAAESWAGIEALKTDHRSNYPFVLSVDDLGEGFALTAQVQSPMDPARICDYMHRALEQLIGALEHAPNSPLRSLDVVPEPELHQLLVEWNDTATDYPRDVCIQHLFEAQVERTPDAVAVVFEDRQVSYAELNARANQLAHKLIALGVGPETLVGLCVERSVEMVVAMLGILKAGGAYVPLDPDYPAARLAFMLEDTAAPVLLTQSGLVERIPAYAGHVVSLDADWAAIGRESEDNPQVPVSARNLAYVIYTSGSTGQPKGILLPHATLVNLMAWHGQGASGERVAQLTSISFDVSLQETLHALLYGKTLFIADNDTRLQPEKLVVFLQEQAITDLFVPNIVLEHLAQAVVQSRHHLQALANVYQAGEALTITPVVREFFNSHPACRLQNHYGPAESHVVTAAALPADPKLWPDRPAIGSPISNTRIYVLDRYRNPVPIGAAGELYIGGDGLARGYLNRPELTAERFVQDPFSTVPGARMYRSGDLARYCPDGSIEYLGRLDDQVKLRGFRIEPGEIEATLAGHRAVREAVVLAREDTPGDKRLVAYVVADEDADAELVDQLRTQLRASLPEYMVPSAFVMLDALPLTPNGKIDRKALPAPGQLRLAMAGEYIAPRNATEELLAGIWAEVLGLDRVGVEDNFFDLGGHSLLATQVMSRLRERTGADLPLLMLFQSPTAAALAGRISVEEQPAGSSRADATSTTRVIIEQSANVVGPSGRAPFDKILDNQRDVLRTWRGKRFKPESLIVTRNNLGANQGLFWCLQADHELARLAEQLGSDQPVHGMRSGHLIMEHKDENVTALAQRYVLEMIAMQPVGSFLIGGNCQGGVIARAIALQLQELGRTVSLLILMEPFEFRPYGAPVSLLFGHDSFFNPFEPVLNPEALMEAGLPAEFKPVANPDVVFRRAYPAGYTVDIIAGAHGFFFESPNVETLAAAVKSRLPNPAGVLQQQHTPPSWGSGPAFADDSESGAAE